MPSPSAKTKFYQPRSTLDCCSQLILDYFEAEHRVRFLDIPRQKKLVLPYMENVGALLRLQGNVAEKLYDGTAFIGGQLYRSLHDDAHHIDCAATAFGQYSALVHLYQRVTERTPGTQASAFRGELTGSADALRFFAECAEPYGGLDLAATPETLEKLEMLENNLLIEQWVADGTASREQMVARHWFKVCMSDSMMHALAQRALFAPPAELYKKVQMGRWAGV